MYVCYSNVSHVCLSKIINLKVESRCTFIGFGFTYIVNSKEFKKQQLFLPKDTKLLFFCHMSDICLLNSFAIWWPLWRKEKAELTQLFQSKSNSLG